MATLTLTPVPDSNGSQYDVTSARGTWLAWISRFDSDGSGWHMMSTSAPLEDIERSALADRISRALTHANRVSLARDLGCGVDDVSVATVPVAA